jgi:D-3-phosphoglycerate dehydrogenase / 2-oxoglutarate reductase
MKEQKIVSVGPLPQWVVDEFFSPFEVVALEDSNRAALLACLDARVVAIISRGPVFIDAEIMQAASSLKAIARTGVGLDTVDVEAASGRKIAVLYTPGAMSRAVAEHVLALILSAAKDLFQWHKRVLSGDWQTRYHLHNLDLEGTTLGIVGLGRIGRQVWRLARPFDMKVLVCDPYLDSSEFPGDELQFVSLEELLESSDIVTLHVPLNPETRGLINSGNIDRFKAGAILVNTARGPLIENYDILHSALESGRLRCVAMDTLILEPPDLQEPLFKHPRVILSAHVAARTGRAQERILRTMARSLKALLEGERLPRQNVANPEIVLQLY